jgi:hypothetical protein
MTYSNVLVHYVDDYHICTCYTIIGNQTLCVVRNDEICLVSNGLI